ncbi:MAG TPA: hypothetical protein VER76_09300 [Pyrinomonadaceae bacterium]|nr:hypothetical protein [Pyrinomonadaceae bacterium]
MTLRHPLRRRRKRGDTAQLAAQLAPLEEQDAQAARQQGANGRGTDQNGGSRLIQENGALIVDTDNLHLPKELTETGASRFWDIEPVVLVIVGAMLIFIAFIAWKISEMPTVP